MEQELRSKDIRWSKALTITGIVIAVLNMVLAWTMMFSDAQRPRLVTPQLSSASQSSAQNAKPSELASEKQQKAPAPAKRNSEVPHAADPIATAANSAKAIFDQLIDVAHMEKQSEERRTTLILGFCFALISIGFSLFVMGIEGAVNLQGNASDFGSLVLKVSSPGLFCILLASGIVAFGLHRPVKVDVERKEDVVRAEADGKVDVLNAETNGRIDVLQAEAEAKERVIEAETRAKMDLFAAEAIKKERAASAARR